MWWLGGKGTVSQQYGNRNAGYQYGYHDGMDIAVPVGTGVAALTDGVVVYAGDAGADGFRVGVRMDNGKVYYYGHLSAINVKEGQRVGRGQVVAQSGDTGRSSGPHVHFELDRDTNGRGDSPTAFLERHTGGQVSGGVGQGGRRGGNQGAAQPGATQPGMTQTGAVQPGALPGFAPATEIDPQELRASFGYAAKFYEQSPELKTLIADAVEEKWTPEVFAARLQDTKWYQKNTEAQRAWAVLTTSDPAEAKRREQGMRSALTQQYRQSGVAIPAKRLDALVRDALRFGWSEDEQQDAIAKEFDFDPDKAYGGVAGAAIGDLKARAAEYVVPLSDKTLDQWTQNILRGEADPASFDDYLKTQAKALFPDLADSIDRGTTVEEYLAPYRDMAAETLEMSPDDVDWASPQWANAVFKTDKKGVRTVIGLADWQRKLRTDPVYAFDQTTEFRDKAGPTGEGFRALAASYLVPMSAQSLDKWTGNVLRGESTPHDFEAYAKTQAKSLFPELADSIDRGITVEDYLSPYRETAARTLEMSPDDVDWTAPKWSQAVFQTDEKGARKVMGLADWQKTLRTDAKYQYDKTGEARDQASTLAASLLKRFGMA